MIFTRFGMTAIREAKHLSKAEVAVASEQAPSYITQLEKGDRDRPSITVIRRIAAALDCDPRALYVEPGVDRLLDELVDRINGDTPLFDTAIALLTRLREEHS